MLDVALALGAGVDPVVRSMRGGVSHSYFPPDAFAVAERVLLDTYRPAFVELDSGGTGRSTDGEVPYAVISAGAEGWFVALGWSALWNLRLTRRGSRLLLEAVVEGLDLTLAPGERVPLPETLFGRYTGTLDDGANALRRVLRRDFVPHLSGRPVAPPVSYDHWFQFRLDVHEDDLRAQIAPCAALGVEYFVVDAGWFAGSETSYRRGCGNWSREAQHRRSTASHPDSRISPSACALTACASGCGSTPRSPTPTRTSGAPTPTGSFPPPAPRTASPCSTSAAPPCVTGPSTPSPRSWTAISWAGSVGT
jgi:hypothetical protein